MSQATHPGDAPSDPVATTARSPWIINAAWDLLLFIATPVLIIPALWLSRQRFSPDAIYAFVTAFGATGHHLPGLLRAYGDRGLFRRFRVRFTLVPALLLAISIPLLFTELRQGMMVILVIWGFWHGMMQVYGFARIYDAKLGSHDPRTVRLDWLLCLAWFGVGLINSDGRVYQFLEVFDQAGGFTIPAAAVSGLRNMWNLMTALVTIAYFRHLMGGLSSDNPPNYLKLLTMAISFGYWWYAMVEVDSILYGIALFEIFHDVQYLAIVWVFNRKRVDADPGVGSFSRFLFRRGGSMVGLYLGLVVGYGAISNLQAQVTIASIQNVLVALVWTSTLLHFYFDGFIWKVREHGTRAGLGINDKTTTPAPPPLGDGLRHAAKWTPFLLGVTILAVAQWWEAGVYAAPEERQRREMLRYEHFVRLLPRYDHAHLTLGTRHYAAGDLDAARKSFDRALALSHDRNAQAHYNRGLIDAAGKNHDAAIGHYNRSLELDPHSDQAHHVHFALGAAHQSQGNPSPANSHYRQALRLQPDFAVAHLGLGGLLRETGDVATAREHLTRAVVLLTDSAEDRRHLAAARQQLEELDRDLDRDAGR